MGLPLTPYDYKKSKPKIIWDILIIVLVLLVIIQLYFSSTYSRVYIIGDSMLSTLTGASSEGVSGGDYVLIYDGTPDYGDIVVVRRQTEDEDKTLIKRVIALEGDTLYLDHGALYIKYKGESEFVLVEEDYVEEERNNPNYAINTYPYKEGVLDASGHRTLDTDGHTVADGCIFVMGDNRNVSNDSRSSDYGDFLLEEIVGVVADWSIKYKATLTAWFTFWDFTLPSIF